MPRGRDSGALVQGTTRWAWCKPSYMSEPQHTMGQKGLDPKGVTSEIRARGVAPLAHTNEYCAMRLTDSYFGQ